MSECKLAVCAERVILDASEGNVTLVNILQDISAAGFPLFIQHIAFAFFLRRDPGDPNSFDAQFELRLAGNELHAFPVTVNFEDKPLTRAMVRLNGFVIPGPGSLVARMRHETIHGSAEWELVVRQSAGPEVAASTG